MYEDDVFAKDEITVKLDILATRFARFRQQLIDLGLNQRELNILNQQMQAIEHTLSLQRHAADMAISDDTQDIEKARLILIKEVYPGQGKIIDYFIQLLEYQKSLIDQSRKEANIEYDASRKFHFTLFVIIFLLALLVASFVIRRTIISEKELFLEKEKAQITLKSIGDAVITTNREGLVEYLNPVAEKITGHLTRDVAGQPINKVFQAYDEVNKRWLAECIINFLNHGNYKLPSNDIVLHNDSKGNVNISINIAPIQDIQNNVLGTITTFQDITKERKLAKHIEHQARHDALTGLLNRREFEIKVEQILSLYAEDTNHAMCIMDLDRFKIVNDTVGHTAGDELLKQISSRIKNLLRKSDLFARIGGDEFALFFSHINLSEAEKVCEKVLESIREYQFAWGDQVFRIGASIGLIDAPPQISTFENLYHGADTACYMAKHSGRDRVHVINFDDQGISQKREEVQWVNNINDALEQNRFTLYAQDINPISQAKDLKPHKEVLIRMLDKDGEIVPPMAFIPPAERYNLMSKIDAWVFEQVMALLANDKTTLVYAINLSGQSMADDKFTQSIINKISTSAIEPHRLCFEVTETAAISNMENATRFLSELQNLGCATALDDFGSGLSSFGYLRTLPINYLKIDGLFVRQIVDDPTCRVMVEAIHSIGRTMNLKTIAEFVEDEKILNLLKEMGIDYAQGYFYGVPERII